MLGGSDSDQKLLRVQYPKRRCRHAGAADPAQELGACFSRLAAFKRTGQGCRHNVAGLALKGKRSVLPDHLRQRNVKQFRRTVVGFNDVECAAVHHNHGIGSDLKQQPVARLGLPGMGVMALHFFLGAHEFLLQNCTDPQVTPNGQNRPASAQAHGGVGHRYGRTIARRVVDFSLAGGTGCGCLGHQTLDLGLAFDGDSVCPVVANPGVGIAGQWCGGTLVDTLDHAAVINHQSDITPQRDHGACKLGCPFRQ